jgi:hypothetical protein
MNLVTWQQLGRKATNSQFPARPDWRGRAVGSRNASLGELAMLILRLCEGRHFFLRRYVDPPPPIGYGGTEQGCANGQTETLRAARKSTPRAG